MWFRDGIHTISWNVCVCLWFFSCFMVGLFVVHHISFVIKFPTTCITRPFVFLILGVCWTGRFMIFHFGFCDTIQVTITARSFLCVWIVRARSTHVFFHFLPCVSNEFASFVGAIEYSLFSIVSAFFFMLAQIIVCCEPFVAFIIFAAEYLRIEWTSFHMYFHFSSAWKGCSAFGELAFNSVDIGFDFLDFSFIQTMYGRKMRSCGSDESEYGWTIFDWTLYVSVYGYQSHLRRYFHDIDLH